MNKVRWGLLSTANINRKVIPAIRESERGELVAVASRSLNSAEAYAKKWDIPHAFGSYEAMLASDEVDVVYIGLPNHLHAPWTIKAMKAGKHVLCEKPFVISMEEMNRVQVTADETGMKVAEAFMYRHHPQTKKVGELLEKGVIGDIHVVRGVFNFKLENPNNVRMVDDWGGGCLWDVGCYPMSIAQYIMGGPPEWVFGESWEGDFAVDMVFCGQMGYPNGAMAQISSSFHSPFYMLVEVLGSDGRMVLEKPFNGFEEGDASIKIYDAHGNLEEIPSSDKNLYLGEIEDMNAAILDDAPLYLTLDETRDHIRTLLALYESAETGSLIRLV